MSYVTQSVQAIPLTRSTKVVACATSMSLFTLVGQWLVSSAIPHSFKSEY